MKRKVVTYICSLVALLILFTFPYTQRINNTYEGIAIRSGADEEMIPARVNIDARLKNYLIKDDLLEGHFSISLLPYTESTSCIVSAAMRPNGVSHLFYLCDDGYKVPGYFIPTDKLDSLYIKIKDEDNKKYEIFVPASDMYDAAMIREQAIEYLAAPLP